MKRIVITPSRFQCSAPGYDVDQANVQQMSFDGFSGTYNAAFLVGYVASNGYQTGSGTPNTLTNIATITFGKTFTSPPQVLLRFDDPTYGGKSRDISISNTQGTSAYVSYLISTTQLKVYYIRVGSSPQNIAGPLGFTYYITQV